MEEKGVVMEGKWRVWFSLSAEDWNMHLSCVTMTRVIHPTSFLEGRAKAVTTSREMCLVCQLDAVGATARTHTFTSTLRKSGKFRLESRDFHKISIG